MFKARIFIGILSVLFIAVSPGSAKWYSLSTPAGWSADDPDNMITLLTTPDQDDLVFNDYLACNFFNIASFTYDGSTYPDNSANGDLAFKNDGKVWKRIDGAWVLYTTISYGSSGNMFCALGGSPCDNVSSDMTASPIEGDMALDMYTGKVYEYASGAWVVTTRNLEYEIEQLANQDNAGSQGELLYNYYGRPMLAQGTFFSANERLGIGTSDPQEKLHVSGNILLETGPEVSDLKGGIVLNNSSKELLLSSTFKESADPFFEYGSKVKLGDMNIQFICTQTDFDSKMMEIDLTEGISFNANLNASKSVGIGITPSNTDKLHIYNSEALSDDPQGAGIRITSNINNGYGSAKPYITFETSGSNNSLDGTATMEYYTQLSGNDVISLTSSNGDLTFRVAGEIRVKTSGADHVFNDDYKLRTLDEVEDHIVKNKHLPEIPSAQEMQGEGMGVSEMQTKLLQKVEELTLYLIDQNKRIERLEAENKELKAKLN